MTAPAASVTPLSNAKKTGTVTDNGKGIASMLLAVGLFAIMDAMVKWLGETYSTTQLVFFRAAFAFIPIAFVVAGTGLREALRINNGWGHVFRCVVGMTSLGAYFYCFPRMPLADMIAITFAAPIFVTALSMPLLGERVGPRRWSAVLIGFVGVLVIVQPGTHGIEPIALVALVGTLFYALAAVAVRKLARTDSAVSIVISFTLCTTLVSAVFLPFQWVTPDLPDLALLIGVGLVGGLAQIAMTNAFRFAEVSLVVPFEYSAMLWAALLGFLFWGEIPGNHVWLGVAIVIASGLYILYREAHLGLPRGIARRLQAKR